MEEAEEEEAEAEAEEGQLVAVLSVAGDEKWASDFRAKGFRMIAYGVDTLLIPGDMPPLPPVDSAPTSGPGGSCLHPSYRMYHKFAG